MQFPKALNKILRVLWNCQWSVIFNVKKLFVLLGWFFFWSISILASYSESFYWKKAWLLLICIKACNFRCYSKDRERKKGQIAIHTLWHHHKNSVTYELASNVMAYEYNFVQYITKALYFNVTIYPSSFLGCCVCFRCCSFPPPLVYIGKMQTFRY